MKIEDLFQELHGTLLKKDLIPITKISEKIREKYKNKINLPTNTEVEQIAKFLDIKEDFLYFNPGFVLNPFYYYSDFLIIEIQVFSMEYIQMVQMKKRIEQWEQRIKNCINEKDFERLFHLLDKRVLFDAYKTLYKQIPNNEKFEIFMDLYVRSEYGFQYFEKEFIKEIFSHRKSNKNMHELKEKADKDGYVSIYRGQTSKSSSMEKAYSWTTSYETAEFFANRFDSDGEVLEAKVHINDVVDYLLSRGEEEIIILPETIKKAAV